MNGYDIDGVITAGVMPNPGDVIITGRSHEESAETYAMLHKLGIFNAVYFNPLDFHDKTPDDSGKWKALMCHYLIVEMFYEDEERQAEIIREVNPDTTVVMV